MSSVSSTLGKTFPLEQQKLMLEIQDLEHTCGNRSKKDVLENKKLELEIDSLRNSIDGFRRFEAVRVWAPALSLFLSVLAGAATLTYQNIHDHEFRVSQEMVALVGKMSGKEDASVQTSAAVSLGLLGRNVEPILIPNLSTDHDEIFYNNVALALVTSIRHGNEPSAVIDALLSEISLIIDGARDPTDLRNLQRHGNALTRVMRSLRADGDPRVPALDTKIDSVRNVLVIKAGNLGVVDDTRDKYVEMLRSINVQLIK